MGKIILLAKHNIKLFFQKRALVVLSIIFPIIFFMFFSVLFTNYDDIDKIPIAVIDQDNTELSKQIITSLDKNIALKVISHQLEESEKLLKNNRIEAIFILTEGFEEAVKTTNYDNSVDLIYLDKSNIGPALSDIVASDLMMPISIYKAANQSRKYEETHNYKNMYNKTRLIGEQLVEESFFEMPIVSNVLVPYQQMNYEINITRVLTVNTTIGYSVVVFSFVILFVNGHLMDSWSSKKRLLVANISPLQMYIADNLSVIFTGILILIAQVIIFVIGLGIRDIHAISTMIISLSLHIIFLSQLIIILTSLFQSKTRYQGIIAPLLFILGMLGGAFWSTELLSNDVIKLIQLTPIYQTLTWIRNSLLHMGTPDYTYYCLFLFVMMLISWSVYFMKVRKLRHP